MKPKQKIFAGLCLLAVLWMCVTLPVRAQDYVVITRLRPAEVQFENLSVAVRVSVTSGGPSHLQERVKQLLTAELLGANRSLQENDSAPQAIVQCTLTRLNLNQTQETRTVILAGKVNYVVIKASLEAAYTARRTRGNQTLDATTVLGKYDNSFQDGRGVPSHSQVEEVLIKQVVSSIVKRLANTEEKPRVRLMRKGELNKAIRLAQANQWQQFIDALRALPDKPNDREYEADRKYDIGIAYEALGYNEMWKNPNQAAKNFDLSERYYREAMEIDVREKEYGRGLERVNEGRQYLSALRARTPSQVSAGGGKDLNDDGTSSPDMITNKDVIKMVKARLTEDLIITAIRQAKQKKFSTRVDDLIELKTQGVSPAIIKEMMNSRQR